MYVKLYFIIIYVLVSILGVQFFVFFNIATSKNSFISELYYPV